MNIRFDGKRALVTGAGRGILLASGFASFEYQLRNQINRCYYCGADDQWHGSIVDPLGCRIIKSCADDEVCRTTTKIAAGVITNEFGCHSMLQCQLITILSLQHQAIATGVDMQHLIETFEIVGRQRQIDVCDMCCGDDLCNDNSCPSIRTRLAKFASTGRFNYTTLRIIV